MSGSLQGTVERDLRVPKWLIGGSSVVWSVFKGWGGAEYDTHDHHQMQSSGTYWSCGSIPYQKRYVPLDICVWRYIVWNRLQ